MTRLAGDFAATPSGYVITVFVTVTFALVGALWFDLRGWRSRTDRALAEQTRALAVVVTDAEHTATTADKALSAAQALELQTGILKQRVDALEAKRAHDDIPQGPPTRERRPGGRDRRNG